MSFWKIWVPSGRKNGVPGLERSVVNSERAAPIDRWSVSSCVKGSLALLLLTFPRWEGGFGKYFDVDGDRGALQERVLQPRKNEYGANLLAGFHDS